MCKVNRSSYYDWLKREEVVRSKSNRLLLTEIRAISIRADKRMELSESPKSFGLWDIKSIKSESLG